MKSKICNLNSSLRNMYFFYVFLNPPHSTHLISKLVCLFELSCVTTPNERFKVAWEDELGAELSDETWDKCLTAVPSCSVNSKHQLKQFMVIFHLHYTKIILHGIVSSVSPLCDTCKVTDTTDHAFLPFTALHW